MIFCADACTAPLKNELLDRANALDQRIKAEIKKLTAENREHLAVLLREEEKRLETLASELGKVAESDEVRTAILKSELINLEFRVENEVICCKLLIKMSPVSCSIIDQNPSTRSRHSGIRGLKSQDSKAMGWRRGQTFGKH